MILSDEEVRHLAIDVLTESTERDAQTRIGASNLSNQCDYCLACNMLGDDRATPVTDRAWLGRVWGTAIHLLLEYRIKRRIAKAAERFVGAKAEHHVWFADLEGYGKIGGTIDLMISDDQLLDWKGSTRKKISLLIDFLAAQEGREPVFGRTHKNIKLSEKEYAAEMEKMAYTVTGYFGQTCLYMHGSGARRASLVFVARDGTGYFDNPAGDRYIDPKATHDVQVLSFNYDKAYAEALISRGQAIWNHLAAGGKAAELKRHPLCFPCGMDAADALKEQAAYDALPKESIEASFTLTA